MQTKYTPAQRATKYLQRIAALTGAKEVCGESYRLRAGRMHFLVDSKFVRVINLRSESTCFSVAADPDMPSAEVVASALLQLKNNPRLVKIKSTLFFGGICKCSVFGTSWLQNQARLSFFHSSG